jgi:hypothetical protein
MNNVKMLNLLTGSAILTLVLAMKLQVFVRDRTLRIVKLLTISHTHVKMDFVLKNNAQKVQLALPFIVIQTQRNVQCAQHAKNARMQTLIAGIVTLTMGHVMTQMICALARIQQHARKPLIYHTLVKMAYAPKRHALQVILALLFSATLILSNVRFAKRANNVKMLILKSGIAAL